MLNISSLALPIVVSGSNEKMWYSPEMRRTRSWHIGTGGLDSRCSLSLSECSEGAAGAGASEVDCLGSEGGAEEGTEEVGGMVTGTEVDSDIAWVGRTGDRSDIAAGV